MEGKAINPKRCWMMRRQKGCSCRSFYTRFASAGPHHRPRMNTKYSTPFILSDVVRRSKLFCRYPWIWRKRKSECVFYYWSWGHACHLSWTGRSWWWCLSNCCPKFHIERDVVFFARRSFERELSFTLQGKCDPVYQVHPISCPKCSVSFHGNEFQMIQTVRHHGCHIRETKSRDPGPDWWGRSWTREEEPSIMRTSGS